MMIKRNTCIICSFLAVCVLCSCSYHSKKLEYYSQKSNYISATGILETIQYNEDYTALYLTFSKIAPSFDDNTFKIIGENVQVVKYSEIDSMLKPGDEVTLISAPRYFGDGYVFPIVALSVNKTSFLDFEEGFSNFLTWLRTQ